MSSLAAALAPFMKGEKPATHFLVIDAVLADDERRCLTQKATKQIKDDLVWIQWTATDSPCVFSTVSRFNDEVVEYLARMQLKALSVGGTVMKRI